MARAVWVENLHATCRPFLESAELLLTGLGRLLQRPRIFNLRIDERKDGKGTVSQLQRAILYNQHLVLDAKMVKLSGWEMPLRYQTGIIQEHLTTKNMVVYWMFDTSVVS